jgi:2-methylcitrate dehydratase PrpD
MAPQYHPTPLSGGDRKALAKELGKARAMANILATQSAEMRAKGEAMIQQADIELQAVAEAGASLSGNIKGRAQDIRVITVESYPGIIERVADPTKFKPQTKGTADHSLPVCLTAVARPDSRTLSPWDPILFHHTAILWARLHGVLAAGRPDGESTTTFG